MASETTYTLTTYATYVLHQVQINIFLITEMLILVWKYSIQHRNTVEVN